MAELFWTSVWLPLLTGLGLSFLIERLIRPGVSSPWQRPLAAHTLHCGLWLLAFAFELALFRRPWFAATVVLIMLVILVLANNAKVHTLREPFIFQDFEYFLDTLRHPRLYLPYFGLGKALLATIAFFLTLLAGMHLESPVTDTMSPVDFSAGLTTLVIVGLLLLAFGTNRKTAVCFEPKQDILNLGFLASLWRYGEEERHCPPVVLSFFARTRGLESSSSLPHLVVVQSESFFDVRRWYAGIRPEVLTHFDALKQEAVCHGQVEVPAWGANTVRTEFAFLSGLPPEGLGVHRFNPYRKVASLADGTLPSLLKERGYRTVCVHPYPASFYGRDRLFPRLGFNQFLDIEAFAGAEKCGPYIGDAAVAAKVCALLSAATCPLFLFVITMENHGPLHWEREDPGDVERFYADLPPTGCEDLSVYLRHLANADRMAGSLAAHLATMADPAWLCWFGDHVPIMPKVYERLGLPDGRTDYLLWSNRDGGGEEGNYLDLQVEDLGALLLGKAGLATIIAPDP